MKKIARIVTPFALAAAIPGSAFAGKPTVDQISRCQKPVPAPLSWVVAFIPCWAQGL